MFKKIKIQFAIIVLITLAYSCVSDEGNYNYTDINTINVTGLEENYTVYTGEHLKLTPHLNPTKDDGSNPDRYSFEWFAVTTVAKNKIATTKDFDDLIKLPPAKYSVYYFVKDLVTGVTWQAKPFTLNVITSIYEGWLIIGEADGKPRLDMVSIIPGVATPRVINDVLDASGSALKLGGKAVDVECFGTALSTSTAYGIYITSTETGTARIDPDSFGWVQSQNMAYETIGGSFETNFGVDFMKSASPGENIIYSKGNIYSYYRAGQVKYGLPQNILDTETKTFFAAPFIAENQGVNGTPVFFDKDLRRFVRYNLYKGNCSAMPPVTGSETVLDWNNTNCDLVFMTTSAYNSLENFAVLKNISTGKYYLLRFNKALTQTYYKEILNAPDIDKATKFAVSPDAGYLFYSVGGKLYEYDNGIQSAKLMIDRGSEEITYLDFNARSKTFAKKLIVGSYNGTLGKLELYTVPPVNGDLVLDNTYSGLCKIVDVTYRAR
ncbi:PKD-like family lipoprotein [Flavobacterium hydrophilum]|uniref:PKD-like family protein n=1 Tax=Flavobacterium hydrophilum TaxID=2211445 RepID=A0A2V4C4V0_9FLAO|nr:PKD-like family lipoprotein [Flavobacterium hydrophilum]PXY45997.1 hypothetical protein DMB68_02080 [Flavobacterium hydrophilum]